jgi:predicted transposase YdaD
MKQNRTKMQNKTSKSKSATLPGIDATKRTFRDTLFRSIYSGKDDRSKRWLLSLYNALSDKNYTDISALEITTIDDVIYVTIKNDLSFLINSEVHLFEQQSTVNPNMPLRGLFYFAQLYQKEVAKRKLDIFGRTRIKIPSPKFVVFYNGAQEQKDIVKYRLSELFEVKDESGEFEWTATVININKNHNESLQKKCQSLYHYCVFVERVKANLDKKMEPKDAVNEAVDFAIRGNFLEGYFKEQRMNIVGNILTEFNQEDYDRNRRAEGYEDGYDDGRTLGRSEGKIEGERQNAIANAKNMLSDAVPAEQVAKWTSLPLEQVLKLKEELSREPATAK